MTCRGCGIAELGDSANLEFFPSFGYRLSWPRIAQALLRLHQSANANPSTCAAPGGGLRFASLGINAGIGTDTVKGQIGRVEVMYFVTDTSGMRRPTFHRKNGRSDRL
jgi:hypothetical protein